jgi:hypothetical protein
MTMTETKKKERNKRDEQHRDRGPRGNISRVDVVSPDLEKFPLFANTHHTVIVLGMGEFIYIHARC